MKGQVIRLALCLALFCLSPAPAAWAKDLTGNSNIQLVRELYNNVRDTLPSEVNAAENTQTIQNRLRCYEEIHDYGQRIQICNNKYVKSIVQHARKAVHSRPSLGEFVLTLIFAPFFTIYAWGRLKTTKIAVSALKGSA